MASFSKSENALLDSSKLEKNCPIPGLPDRSVKIENTPVMASRIKIVLSAASLSVLFSLMESMFAKFAVAFSNQSNNLSAPLPGLKESSTSFPSPPKTFPKMSPKRAAMSPAFSKNAII